MPTPEEVEELDRCERCGNVLLDAELFGIIKHECVQDYRAEADRVAKELGLKPVKLVDRGERWYGKKVYSVEDEEESK